MSRIPYHEEPDFSRPSFNLPAAARQRMLDHLTFLYGDAQAGKWLPELERILKVHHAHKPSALIEAERTCDPTERFTERDSVLVTYGDSIAGNHGETLQTLHRFVETYNSGAINTIHLLPFFPYSSDRGFSVVDFRAVDPSMGTWESIREMGADYELMFDGVVNHCSSRSSMFRDFLCGSPQFKDFFIAYDSPDDLTADQRSKIFRPRTSDILTRFDTIDGPKYVWTTFSDDQIDFNFRNPRVLLAVLDGLLFYVRQGADILRLDAVTYLWSEPGTECIHLPETHAAVKLIRTVMDTVAPRVALITETNVPHEENISYFGNGYDEAHMVYNFALPPLVLHTFYTGNAGALSQWASELDLISDQVSFFNILDTHDGIGVMGVKGILEPSEIEQLVERAKAHGAFVGYKTTEAGEEPYEINTTWWSAINRDESGEDLDLRVKRYVASRAIALVLKGVPGTYTHGMLALSADRNLAEQSGVKRDINRGLIDPAYFARELADPRSKRSLLRRTWSSIFLNRVRNAAFHPQGGQKVLSVSPSVFAVLRTSPQGDQHILTLTSVSREATALNIDPGAAGIESGQWVDLIAGGEVAVTDEGLKVSLAPYQVMWLTADPAAAP